MNPQNGQTPLDYLNEIAPQAPKRPIFQLNLKTIIIGAVLAVVLISIIALVVGGIANGRKQPWETLSARLATTQSLADDATGKLKDSRIRSINSDLKLYLTNTRRDSATPLTRAGIDSAKLSPSVIAAESGAAVSTRLEDARLNARFDSTYAREMSFQLATLLSLYQELYGSASQTETKTYLQGAYDNLAPIQKSFSDYSAANE